MEEKGGEIPEEQPVMIGKCVHDKGDEVDDYDDEGDGYNDDVEDGCEDDGIFDDHVIEQYGRQGYGGWD